MNRENNWEIGLPIPRKYIGHADLLNYYISYHVGYYINMIGITPNMITLFGILCFFASGFFIIHDSKLFAITFAIGTLSDTMDGFNARIFNKRSKYGALIDHGADWISAMTILSVVIWKWYNKYMLYIILPIIVYLERQNIIYSGYIQEYQGQTDIFISTLFQHKSDDSYRLDRLLKQYKQYNSSTLSLIIIAAIMILQMF